MTEHRERTDPFDPDGPLVWEAAKALHAAYDPLTGTTIGDDTDREHATHGCLLAHDDPRNVAHTALDAVRQHLIVRRVQPGHILTAGEIAEDAADPDVRAMQHFPDDDPGTCTALCVGPCTCAPPPHACCPNADATCSDILDANEAMGAALTACRAVVRDILGRRLPSACDGGEWRYTIEATEGQMAAWTRAAGIASVCAPSGAATGIPAT